MLLALAVLLLAVSVLFELAVPVLLLLVLWPLAALPLLWLGNRGLGGLEDCLGALVENFDLAVGGKGDSLSKRDV